MEKPKIPVLGGRHTLLIDGCVGQRGIEEITRYLAAVGVAAPPEEVGWQWEVTGKKTYTGTLPKRINKWAFKSTGKKLPKEHLERIGYIASEHRVDGQEYWFEFNPRLDWKAGDFGDNKACFFLGNNAKRDALIACKWVGMCFYTDDTYTQGIGRLLVLPCRDHFFVMNGYWKAADYYNANQYTNTIKTAQVLAKHLGLDYKEITCRSFDGDYIIYSNSTKAIVVGEKDVIAPIKEHKLRSKPE